MKVAINLKPKESKFDRIRRSLNLDEHYFKHVLVEYWLKGEAKDEKEVVRGETAKVRRKPSGRRRPAARKQSRSVGTRSKRARA